MSSDIFDLEAAEARVAMLDEQINSQQRVVARIKSKRASVDTAARLARRRLSVLRFMRWIRSPSKSYGLWKPGLQFTSVAFSFAISFVATDVVIGS
jgi:hypothetical protein